MSYCKDLVEKLTKLQDELESKKEEYRNIMTEMRFVYNLSKLYSYKANNVLYKIPIISYFLKNKRQKLLLMSELQLEISKKYLYIANIVNDTIEIIEDHIQIIRNKIILEYKTKRIKRMTIPIRNSSRLNNIV